MFSPQGNPGLEGLKGLKGHQGKHVGFISLFNSLFFPQANTNNRLICRVNLVLMVPKDKKAYVDLLYEKF